MSFFGTFHEFSRRVLSAVKKGGLNSLDLTKLGYLLKRTEKRNKILARGILSALNSGGATESSIKKLANLFEKAEKRIFADQPPFTASEKAEIAKLLEGHVSKRTERWIQQLDALVAGQFCEEISGKKDLSVRPFKKSIAITEKTKRRKNFA